VGWFGPRRIASILYIPTVLEAGEVTGEESIYTVAMITVFLSVLAHGISAALLVDWYGKHIAALDNRDAADSETVQVPEMPTGIKGIPARSGSYALENVRRKIGEVCHGW
jgi:NhaP-type Na+/H+ or K+/H+ antiporter